MNSRKMTAGGMPMERGRGGPGDNQQWAIDLCEALGIDHTKVSRVDLTIEAGGRTYVTVKSYVEPKGVEQVIRRYRLDAHEDA